MNTKVLGSLDIITPAFNPSVWKETALLGKWSSVRLMMTQTRTTVLGKLEEAGVSGEDPRSLLSLSQKELGPDSASLPCQDAATLTPPRSGGVSGEAHTFSAESEEREAKAGRGVHAQGLPNPPSLGSSQSKEGAETAGVFANGTSSGETEGGLGTPSRHCVVRAQARRGGFAPSPTTAPPARALPENDHILLVSLAGIGLSGGHLLRPARFPISVSSDVSTLTLTPGPHLFLVQRQHQGPVFPPHGGFLTLSKAQNHNRLQYARVCSVPPCTELNVALGRAALPSRLPLQPAPRTGQLAPWPALCS